MYLTISIFWKTLVYTSSFKINEKYFYIQNKAKSTHLYSFLSNFIAEKYNEQFTQSQFTQSQIKNGNPQIRHPKPHCPRNNQSSRQNERPQHNGLG